MRSLALLPLLAHASLALGPPPNPLLNNPLTNVVRNTYSFFYWLPRRNMPFDRPWAFGNSSKEFLAWYQWPHNLPPYRYLECGQPADFFCFGLPGNTLPLGDWDPFGLQLVSEKVVRRYRESELKHGRLAMLGSAGFLLQEAAHPLHASIGGLAATHMDQLAQMPLGDSVLAPLLALLGGAVSPDAGAPDYLLLVLALALVEAAAFRRNWTRWARDEYHHPFDHNIGIGNLRRDYSNGDYGFDPLRLAGDSPEERRLMTERELNHGRLAMVGFVGMLGQELLTGEGAGQALLRWLGAGVESSVGVSAALSAIGG